METIMFVSLLTLLLIIFGAVCAFQFINTQYVVDKIKAAGLLSCVLVGTFGGVIVLTAFTAIAIGFFGTIAIVLFAIPII